MKFLQYINEKRKRNVIVVDIQPMYKNAIMFSTVKFANWLKEQDKILYFYNGPDTVGQDTENDIKRWLLEEISDYDEDLEYKLNHDTIWIDKGYAFFRNWMDMGSDIGFIKKAIRFMLSKKENDSRDINPEVWEENFPNDWNSDYEDDSIYLPDVPINILKKFKGSYIVGGGKDECLKEVQLLMSVFNIKATPVKDFIY